MNEALEFLENHKNMIIEHNGDFIVLECLKVYSVCKQALIKAQKQEKALEILKKHFNFTFDDKHGMLIICIQAKEDEDTYDTSACANIQYLSYNPNVYNKNAQEEFNLLKEVLENEAKKG